MNLFLIDQDPVRSAELFMALDPIRARKQLLEGCQLLAATEILRTGSTTMLRADGQPYRLAHPHHPITQRMAMFQSQWMLAHDVVMGLSMQLPRHACANSFRNWRPTPLSLPHIGQDVELVLVRLHQPKLLVPDRATYASIMSEYLNTKQAA